MTAPTAPTNAPDIPVENPSARRVADPPDTRRPRRRRVWLRWLIGVVVTLACVGAMVLALAAGSRGGDQDPRNYGDAGTAALVALLKNEGVDVTVSDQTSLPATTTGATVVLSGQNLNRTVLASVLDAGPARVVLLGYDADVLAAAGIPVTHSGSTTALRDPRCTDPMAVAAGSIVLDGGLGYALRGSPKPDLACYGSANGQGYGLLAFTLQGVTVDVVAGGLTNDSLRSVDGVVRGNAALGMRLLGQQNRLVWWIVPNDAAAPRTERPGPTIVSDRGALILLASIPLLLVVIVWRGRRLGPIITEKLPVVVPASETVEGHGRLYHRLKAYDTAAEHLRAGTLARLSRRFGTSDPDQLIAVISDRTGLSPQSVADALTGPAPQSETDLWNVRNALAHIEQEARS